LGMVQELDASFAAVAFIGYHSKADSDANPLAHTLSVTKVARLMLNGEPVSEFVLHALAATLYQVPPLFISGDEEVCREASQRVPHIRTVAVNRGVGASTISISPAQARRRIKEGICEALKSDGSRCRMQLPESFKLEIAYATPVEAYRASWYPGVQHSAPRTVELETHDYFEVLRALQFVI
jgi:D-amino peptidase